ncbi:unnamed protein product [Symbiodinium sp. CCMP2592]|nr:unnamed protein product [Symbiodinium sp. CCMP2592]CAE7441245.1 unnamed protein product [Symbiodinium sp. CCMP2592]
MKPERCTGDRRTEANFRRLAAMLEVAEDPDYEFLREFASAGAREDELESTCEPPLCENYSSATANMDDIRRQVEEGLQCASVVAFSKEEALQKFGGHLAVAALGAIPKKAGSSVVRIIHDATHHVEVFGLKYDVSRVHSLVPIREEDWKYQALCLDDPEVIYMHTVGPSALHRPLIIGSGSQPWLSTWRTICASWLPRRTVACVGAGLLIAHALLAYVLELLEIPLSWKTVAGGTSLGWIGYQRGGSTATELPPGLVATQPLSICLLLEFMKKEVERAPMTAPKSLSHVQAGQEVGAVGVRQRRAIGALELVATLVAVCVFGPGAVWRESTTTAVIAGFTDNAGSGGQDDGNGFPAVDHLDGAGGTAGCTGNVLADALTNKQFGDFDPRLRISVDVPKLDFRVLPRLMDAAMQLNSEIRMQTFGERVLP